MSVRVLGSLSSRLGRAEGEDAGEDATGGLAETVGEELGDAPEGEGLWVA